MKTLSWVVGQRESCCKGSFASGGGRRVYRSFGNLSGRKEKVGDNTQHKLWGMVFGLLIVWNYSKTKLSYCLSSSWSSLICDCFSTSVYTKSVVLQKTHAWPAQAKITEKIIFLSFKHLHLLRKRLLDYWLQFCFFFIIFIHFLLSELLIPALQPWVFSSRWFLNVYCNSLQFLYYFVNQFSNFFKLHIYIGAHLTCPGLLFMCSIRYWTKSWAL